MSHPANPTAVVIIIGNEILSGRTRDSNLAYIGGRCDELGIALREARVIRDDEATIIATVNLLRAEHDYVFTTGGIGPTHDDITALAVARAFGVSLHRHPDAVAVMEKYYPPGMLNEARLKMAEVPEGATLIDNPITAAPGFQIGNVFVFPGVPTIMQAMFGGITHRLTGGPPMLTENIRTSLMEGNLAEGLGRVQADFPEVSIGSYPFFRQGVPGVNLVLRATDAERLAAAADRVTKMITELEGSANGTAG